jgi:hypothetical protein
MSESEPAGYARAADRVSGAGQEADRVSGAGQEADRVSGAGTSVLTGRTDQAMLAATVTTAVRLADLNRTFANAVTVVNDRLTELVDSSDTIADTLIALVAKLTPTVPTVVATMPPRGRWVRVEGLTEREVPVTALAVWTDGTVTPVLELHGTLTIVGRDRTWWFTDQGDTGTATGTATGTGPTG